MPPVARVWLKNSLLDSTWLPCFPRLFHQIFNTNGFQEEVGWAEGVTKGPAVLHPGWFICCIRDIWARASHHQGAFLRVVEEAQLQRGVHQEGGAQLSAATGKMFRGYAGPLYMFPQRLINDLVDAGKWDRKGCCQDSTLPGRELSSSDILGVTA